MWPYAPGARGIVICPPTFADRSANILIGGGPILDAARLRTWTLFWDRLDLPDNNFVQNWVPTQETDLLQAEGILKRSQVTLSGLHGGGDVPVVVNTATLKEQMARAPGRWSMALGPGALELPASAVDEGQGLMFTLHNGIPIPDAAVPIEAVLEFKRRRNAELLALRAYMDDAYQIVINSADPNHALTAAVAKIEKAIADQVRASREAPIRFRLSTMRVTLKTLWTAGAAAGAAAVAGVPLLGVAAAAGISAAGEIVGDIEVSAALKGLKADGAPFGYINHYREELPILASW